MMPSVPLLTPEMWVTCVACGNRRTLGEIGTVGPIACTCGSTTYNADQPKVGLNGNVRMVELARLDADRTAKPKTRLLAHSAPDRYGFVLAGPADTYEGEDGERVGFFDCRFCQDTGYQGGPLDEWPCVCNPDGPPGPPDERTGLVLPGWTCARCGAFNGEVKEKRVACRACTGLPGLTK